MPEISRKTMLLGAIVLLLIVFLYVQNSKSTETFGNYQSVVNQAVQAAQAQAAQVAQEAQAQADKKAQADQEDQQTIAIGGKYIPKTEAEKAIRAATEEVVKVILKSSNKLEWDAVADRVGQMVTSVIKYTGMMSKSAGQKDDVAKNVGNMVARIGGQMLNQIDRTVEKTNSYY